MYKRVAPGLLDGLQRVIPRDDTARLKSNCTDWAEDCGIPRVGEQLAGGVVLSEGAARIGASAEG